MTENHHNTPAGTGRIEAFDQGGGYQQAFRLLMHAPVAICMLRLPDFVIELANPPMLELWDRDASAIGKKTYRSFYGSLTTGF